MRLQKILFYFIIYSIFFLSLPAFAGGPEPLMPPEPKYSGIYIDLNIGYANTDWRNYGLSPPNFTGDGTNLYQTLGGFTFGGDLGYQFNQFWNIEAGWFYVPLVRGTFDGVQASAQGGFGYGAGKISVPIIHDFYFFGKFGIAYRYTRLYASAPQFFIGQSLPINGRYWAPLFGLGVQYYFEWAWSINVEYLRVPGYETIISEGTSNRLNTPPMNVITVGIGYKLAI